MFIQRRMSFSMLLRVGWVPMSFASGWSIVVYALYEYAGLTFLKLPFLPIATVGTAVAFYVGFKNNAAYDRFWEGRKIWGGIVNESRTWATQVLAYVLVDEKGQDAQRRRKTLVYRQLAWINALRIQLRQKSRFFDKPARATARRLARDEAHMRNDWDKESSPFLAPEEHASIRSKVNPATHLLHNQSQDLRALLSEKRLDLFHQIALMEVVRELYALQGKCERIKNTPFPRLFAVVHACVHSTRAVWASHGLSRPRPGGRCWGRSTFRTSSTDDFSQPHYLGFRDHGGDRGCERGPVREKHERRSHERIVPHHRAGPSGASR